MSVQLYQSKKKFKADRKFEAGYGAFKFVPGTNPSVWHVVLYRPIKGSGELTEISSEFIPADMVEGLRKKAKPYICA